MQKSIRDKKEIKSIASKDHINLDQSSIENASIGGAREKLQSRGSMEIQAVHSQNFIDRFMSQETNSAIGVDPKLNLSESGTINPGLKRTHKAGP